MTNISTDYSSLLSLIRPFVANGRSESASFLAWYLANYYRLEDIEAVDSVCDQSGDRGVDGVYLNAGEGTIDIFQSKINQKIKSSIGDSTLREFAGTLSQFSTKKKRQELAKNTKGKALGLIIERLNLIENPNGYSFRGIFLSNTNIDANGQKFLSARDDIVFVGSDSIVSNYVSDERWVPKHKEVKFDISGYSVASYKVDQKSSALIAPVSASDLVKLPGIQDQSLFSRNVRASLGKTQVNRDIQESIRNKRLHKMFPLFHNGITVIAKHVKTTETSITIKDYYVVNGCQSLNALFHNRSDLTEPPRDCRRLQLLRRWSHYEQNNEQVFN